MISAHGPHGSISSRDGFARMLNIWVGLILIAVWLATALPNVRGMGEPWRPVAAYPHQGEVAGYADTARNARRPRVFAVGDSILTGVYHSQLRHTRPGWEVSAVPGRDVSNLPYYLYHRVNTVRERRSLRKVVIALGTNADPAWTYAKLSAAVRMLPPRVRVIFVTTYRDPRIFPDSVVYRSRASIQPYYTRWMGTIAAARPNTRIMDWRSMVAANPSLIHDGVHPTAEGMRVYARALERAVGR